MSEGKNTEKSPTEVSNEKSGDKKSEEVNPRPEIRYPDEEPIVEKPLVMKEMEKAFNVINAPKVCPPGYRLDSAGKCRRIM